jgi:hypothetical protein
MKEQKDDLWAYYYKYNPAFREAWKEYGERLRKNWLRNKMEDFIIATLSWFFFCGFIYLMCKVIKYYR